DEANSYGLLVGVASMEVPTLLRVAPGDPRNSYLIHELEGAASLRDRVPLRSAPPPQARIDVVRHWILVGAVDDRPPSRQPVRVSSLSPVPDSELETAPEEIVAMFDRELDVSTVNAQTFILEASGGDGTFEDGNEAPVTAAGITTPDTNPTS